MIEKIKRKSGFTYRARIYWLDGKILQETFKRKVDAEAWKRTKLQEKDQTRVTGITIQDSVSFEKFVEKWLIEKVISRLSPSTQAAYDADLRNHLLPVLKDIPLRNIRLDHGNQVVLKMQAKRRSAKTINGVLGLLQGILNDAVKWQFLNRNPLIGLKPLDLTPEVVPVAIG